MSNLTPNQNEPKTEPKQVKYSDLKFSNKEPEKPITPEELPAVTYRLLSNIEIHLSSIRSMLQFFVVLTILVIAIQACSLIL